MWNGSNLRPARTLVQRHAPRRRCRFKDVIGPTNEKIEKFRVKMRKFFAVGDHVVAIGSSRGRGKATGKDLDVATAHVWTLRNGKAVRFEGFHDSTEWREALGLAQPEPQRMAA